MVPPIVLTPHQCEAVSWVVDQLMQGVPLVAITGLAGTGKSTLVSTLRTTLEGLGVPVAIGAPTHRAAMVLRKKGIAGATTIHQHALTPYFSPDYARASEWLGKPVPTRLVTDKERHDDVEGVPWLLAETLKRFKHTAKAILRQAHQHGARKAMAYIGLDGRQHLDGWGPKRGEGCIIIDEASMVGKEMLELCQEAFPLVCLVGDPGQLPPVQDSAHLEHVPGFALTEIHRQAADSPIVQLAYAAREGQRFWECIPVHPGQIEEYARVEAQAFLESPLIVWRNEAREECTQAIRAELGYPPRDVRIGEPLVCRSTDKEDRALGFFNNALFRVVAMSSINPRKVTVQEDGGEKTHDILLHVEELHGQEVDPKAIKFRMGYCLTAHTAQGGEWPTVFISKPEVYRHAGFFQARQEEEETRRWTYTAITRAKERLGFLTGHHFDRSLIVAVPEWNFSERQEDMAAKSWQTPSPTATDPLIDPPPLVTPASGKGATPVPDDIPEPITPPAVVAAASAPLPAPPLPTSFGEHEALLQGFCQVLQQRVRAFMLEEHSGLMQTLDATLVAMRKWVETVGTQNEHANYQMSDTLLKLQERGLQLRHDPYHATVKATSPQGFVVSISLAKGDNLAVIEEIPNICNWLKAQGFTAVPTIDGAGVPF